MYRDRECHACYMRAYRGHTIQRPCAVCGLDDIRMLQRATLRDGETVLCGNHAALAGRRKRYTVEDVRRMAYEESGARVSAA